MTPDAASALDAAARFGPYFTWEPRDEDPAWRPLSDLRDETVVAERVEAARRTLLRMSGLPRDDIPERVVASVTFLGLASRLVSPLLGAVVAAGTLPRPGPAGLWWRPVDSGPIPIAYDPMPATAGAGDFAGVALRGLVGPMVEVFGGRFGLSGHVLWGNVASALGGAAGMIATAGSTTADRPAYVRGSASDAAGRAELAAGIVRELLNRAPLVGMATLERPEPEVARWFLVRRNCCLYYRIPGGGTCGDCVLTPEDVRRQQWQAALRR
jgi:hypothetical protein